MRLTPKSKKRIDEVFASYPPPVAFDMLIDLLRTISTVSNAVAGRLLTPVSKTTGVSDFNVNDELHNIRVAARTAQQLYNKLMEP